MADMRERDSSAYNKIRLCDLCGQPADACEGYATALLIHESGLMRDTGDERLRLKDHEQETADGRL